MSAFSRRTPHEMAPDGELTPERESGVEIIVHAPPAEAEAAEPGEEEPDSLEPYLRAIVVPEGQPTEDRDEFMRWIENEWGWLIDRKLGKRTDILEESRKDLRQRVLLVLLGRYMKERKEPDNVPGFVGGVIRGLAKNHTQRRRIPIAPDADPDAEQAPAKDPEGAAVLAQDRQTLARHLARLRPEEAEAVVAIDFQRMTYDEAANHLRRHRSTVASQHDRALKKLAEMMREGRGRR